MPKSQEELDGVLATGKRRPTPKTAEARPSTGEAGPSHEEPQAPERTTPRSEAEEAGPGGKEPQG